jgi:hypothetical protein
MQHSQGGRYVVGRHSKEGCCKVEKAEGEWRKYMVEGSGKKGRAAHICLFLYDIKVTANTSRTMHQIKLVPGSSNGRRIGKRSIAHYDTGSHL